MNLKTQEYICTLAECGSITEAAKRLYITQPALSMYISNVEKAIDVKLFDRRGKKVELTYAGELYVHKAQKMLEMQKEFYHEVTDIRTGVKGRVRIGLQRKRSTMLTVNILKNFKGKYPDVELQFVLGDWAFLLEKYEENSIDVLIYNDQCGINNDEGEVLLNEKVLLTVSRICPTIETSVYIPDMSYRWLDIRSAKGPFILPPHGASLRSDIETLCRNSAFQIKDYTEIAHIETAMQLAAEGFGMCFTRESYAAQFHYTKRPIFLMVGDPILSSQLCMKYNQKQLRKDYFVELLDVIKRCVESIISDNLI